jgi:hypothetical protein
LVDSKSSVNAKAMERRRGTCRKYLGEISSGTKDYYNNKKIS